MALSEPDPELFTIATLTGHACLGKQHLLLHHRLFAVIIIISVADPDLRYFHGSVSESEFVICPGPRDKHAVIP